MQGSYNQKMIGSNGVTHPFPMDNGLTNEQNQAACTAIYRLKLHELANMVSCLGLRKPRAPKHEHQKLMIDSLYDNRFSRNIYNMATHYSQGLITEPMHQKRGVATQGRHHPYGLPNRNGASNQIQNNVWQPQQVVQHMLQYPGQVTHSMTTGKYHADRFEAVKLPFYDVASTLLEPVELHSISNSSKVARQLSFHFGLTPDDINKVAYRNEVPLPRFEVQLRFFNISEPGSPQKDDFPLNCQARVDEQIIQLPNVIPTNKPNAEPKRPSRPVNITPYLNRYKQREHTLSVDWLADKRTWAAGIYLVYRVNSDILFERLEKNTSRHRSLEYTKQEVIKKLSGGEDDIAMDQLKISLRDPLSKMRMKTPVRCQDCTHLQCFDLLSYLMMNEKKPTWQCPVCSGNCPFDRLIIDNYFLDMLAKVDRNMTEVELKIDGSYDVIREEADVCLSDDDDIDIKPSTNGSTSSSNFVAPAENGGKKKKAPLADDEIITLSDDDDEDLNRGIQNSLEDIFYEDRNTASASSSQKTPPQKKNGKDNAIEYITLDDTPPRPVVAPMRQVSQQNQMPSSSPPVMAAPTPNIREALNGLHFNTTEAQTLPPQASPIMAQHQLPQHSINYQQQPAYMNGAQSSGSNTPTSPYAYPAMMPPQFHMQNGMIGRNNQMAHMQQQHHHQQPPQGIMPGAYYGQPQVQNGSFFYASQYQQQHQYRPS